MLYPIVGATLARLWYNENITPRAALGILVIVIGGVATFAPGIVQEFTGAGSGAWIGYMGGAMAAAGWGIEGAIAGRVLDVSDPDVGITIRFTAETFYWVFLILPAMAIFTDVPVLPMVASTMNFWALTWLMLAGLSFAFCYVAWYKSFPLIGVGRGQAIAALYGVFAVIYLAVFTLNLPDWNFLLGLTLALAGAVVMITENSEVVEVVRKFTTEAQPIRRLQGSRRVPKKLHMKGFILRLLGKSPEGLWDYDIMRMVLKEYGHTGDYWKGEVRVTLTDLYSGALIDEIEDELDDGQYFAAGKVLVKFRLSPTGRQRMAETGLL